MHIQQLGVRGDVFLKIKKSVQILERKTLTVSVFGSDFPFRCSFKNIQGEKLQNVSLRGVFFLNVYRSALVPQTPPFSPALKNFCLRVCTHTLFFCKRFHLKRSEYVCLDNCSVMCTVTLCYMLYQTHSEFWHIQHSVSSGVCKFNHIHCY